MEESSINVCQVDSVELSNQFRIFFERERERSLKLTMTSLIANSITKPIEQYLSRDEKETSKHDIQYGPPIVESSQDEEELGDDIDDDADQGEDEFEYE